MSFTNTARETDWGWGEYYINIYEMETNRDCWKQGEGKVTGGRGRERRGRECSKIKVGGRGRKSEIEWKWNKYKDCIYGMKEEESSRGKEVW